MNVLKGDHRSVGDCLTLDLCDISPTRLTWDRQPRRASVHERQSKTACGFLAIDKTTEAGIPRVLSDSILQPHRDGSKPINLDR